MAYRALIVDDDQDIQVIHRAWLESDGFEVTVAGSVDEALRLYDPGSYGVVFTDLNMVGDKTGVDLLREIRRRDQRAAVVLVTSNPAWDYKKRPLEEVVKEAGGIGIMGKPVPGDDLQSVAGAICMGWWNVEYFDPLTSYFPENVPQ